MLTVLIKGPLPDLSRLVHRLESGWKRHKINRLFLATVLTGTPYGKLYGNRWQDFEPKRLQTAVDRDRPRWRIRRRFKRDLGLTVEIEWPDVPSTGRSAGLNSG